MDGGRGNDPNMPGLGVLANDILTHISKKINGTSMNTIQDVQYALNQFELSVEFVNAFLERLCNTERSYNPGGYVSGGSTNRSECEKQRQWIHPVSRPLYAGQINIFEFVFALVEVLHLHPALVHQGFEAIIEPTHADAQFFCQFALREVGVFLQDAHHPEISVFL